MTNEDVYLRLHCSSISQYFYPGPKKYLVVAIVILNWPIVKIILIGKLLISELIQHKRNIALGEKTPWVLSFMILVITAGLHILLQESGVSCVRQFIFFYVLVLLNYFNNINRSQQKVQNPKPNQEISKLFFIL